MPTNWSRGELFIITLKFCVFFIIFSFRYEKVEDDKTGTAPSKHLKVVLFLGNEIYQGSGINIKAAKQQAAAQALQNTKYQSKAEKIASIPTMST